MSSGSQSQSKTNRHTPLPVDSRFRYLEYKDRYRGIIRKRARTGTPRPDRTIKRLVLHPDKVDVNRRCLAWPYCDREVKDNDYNVVCRIHWYVLPKYIRNEVQAVLRRFPKGSRIRKGVLKIAAIRLQLAGKRGEVVRGHMREYTVVDNGEEL